MLRLILGALVLLFAATPAYAQFNFTGQSALTIVADPAAPAPYSSVHLTVQSPLLDLAHSSISWRVGGSPAGNGPSIDVPVGAAGSRTIVSVFVSGTGDSDTASVTLIPAAVDLLWEADSYVPPFYGGRAVPTSGSIIRAMAIPHLSRTDGSAIPQNTLTFTWKINGATLSNQSGVGANTARIPAAILYGNDTITVDVSSQDGSITGEASAVVRTGNPQLLVYIDDPLFGILYHRALRDSTTMTRSDGSFAAVPYFIEAKSPQSTALAYHWSVNGTSIAPDATLPNEITIRSQAPGTAQIALTVGKPSDPFVSADASWAVSFGTASSNSGVGADAFHTPTN